MRLFFIMVTSLLILSSCHKENAVALDEYESEIVGSWSRTDVIPSGVSNTDLRYFDMITTYTFDADKQYSYKVEFYGFEDENPEEVMGSSENIGTYEVRGDSLFIKAEVNTSWEEGFQPNPHTIQLNGRVYGNKFSIVADRLLLYYISYPADAPVPTQMGYDKVHR